MAQPSGHDFCYREPSIGKGWTCADRSGAFASRLAPTRVARAFVGAGLLANGCTADLTDPTNRVQLLIFNWNNPIVF
ncbi:hypothetical protein D3C71_1828710 [compost metagenome]